MTHTHALVPLSPTAETIERICAAVAPADWPDAYSPDVQASRRRDAKLAFLEMLRGGHPQQPSGWKLVPVEPTVEMIHRGGLADTKRGEYGPLPDDVWAAMIEAVPAHPSQPSRPYGGDPAEPRDDSDRPAEQQEGGEAAPPNWMTLDDSRRRMAMESLKSRAKEMRHSEAQCRSAYNGDYMGIPCRYVADAYLEATKVFEARLAAIDAAMTGGNGNG